MSLTTDERKLLSASFWDGKVDNTQYFLDRDGIKIAVRRAFRDLTVRTMTRNDSSTSVNLEALADNAFDGGFYEKISEWLNSNPTKDGFDSWHNEACDFIIEFLKETYIPADCTYGKAQKIVNMTFKNMYCLEDAEKKEEHFKFCHMPLDSFTLEWFYRECKRQEKKIVKSKILSWSSLSFSKDDERDGKYTYNFFQNKIIDLIENSADFKGYTPLQAEFKIWPEIQLHLGAEGFMFQLKKDDAEFDKDKFKKHSITEKIQNIKEAIKKY